MAFELQEKMPKQDGQTKPGYQSKDTPGTQGWAG